MASLLQQPSDIPMRPIRNKDMEIVDLDQLFEDYGETDLLHHFSEASVDRSSSDDLAHLFELPSSNESDLFGTESILDREPDSAWHKAPRKCEQNPASSMLNDSSSFYIDSKGKSSLSDSELLSFEDLFELERNQLRSISQPSTPRPHTTRSVKKAVSFNDRSVPRGVQKSLKKSPATSFAKMMQPMYYRSPIPDVWTRKMDAPADAFHLRGPSNGITSPPLSSKIVQHENGNGFFAQDHQQPYNTRSSRSGEEPHTPGIDFSNYQLTPQASPGIGVSNNGSNPFDDHMGLAFSSSSVSSAALSALQTPPSSLRIPMTTWGTDTSPSLDFGFSASPDFSATSKTAGWWNDDAAAQGSAGFRESNSRSTSQNMALNGLGISCDTAAFGSFGAVGLGVSVGENMPGASASSFDVGSYNAMYPTPPQQHIVSIGHRPLSRSPSPCPQPRFHRRRPSSHSHASHHRASHSSTASSRRKSSQSSQQSSRQSSNGNVGFVNFTPDDSRKILTGVAPSGSSKTKARREKEAAEKRRKLSQAAMKAVMEAGGDVDSLRRLEREGLLVLES
ncbi:Nn.00g027030.m01.CDS01 [Neocucurbitaria sp. VM-36]